MPFATKMVRLASFAAVISSPGALPIKDVIREMRALPLKDEVKDKWLYENAAKLFSLD